MKPAPFSYHRAATAEEAVSLLSELGDEAKLLAGGQSLVAMMNFRLARPSALVDISRIDALRYIAHEDDGLRIGAMARHCDFERLDDPRILSDFPVLSRAARLIGHYVIRSSGTFGGSLAHADPAAEWCMIALLLDAEITILGPSGKRMVPAREFFKGFLETDLGYDEMIIEVRLPVARPNTGFQEFALRHGDFAVVAAGVTLDVEDGRVVEPRVVLGGVGGMVLRSEAAEESLAGAPVDDATFAAAAGAAAADINPPPDLQGSPEYRRHLASVLVRRALEEATADVA